MRPFQGFPSTFRSMWPSIDASSISSPPEKSSSSTSIPRAATDHMSPSPRRATTRYGGSTCFSTASASGDRSASPCSVSTITSPLASVANSAVSPWISGACTLTTASYSPGRAIARTQSPSTFCAGYVPANGSVGLGPSGTPASGTGASVASSSPASCSSCSFSVSLRLRKSPISERGRANFPEVAFEPLGVDGELPSHACAELVEPGQRAEDAGAVDRERRAVGGVREVDRVTLRPVRELDHLDAAGLDRPEALPLPRGPGAVRRRNGLLDGCRERLQRAVRPVLDEQRPVGERHEAGGVSHDVRCVRGDGGVPFAGALNAVHTHLLPPGTWIDGSRPSAQAGLSQEALVQRLAPPEQGHAQSNGSGAGASPFRCLSGVRRFAPFFSRSSRTWRMSFSVSSSIDAFMSPDASRARRV